MVLINRYCPLRFRWRRTKGGTFGPLSAVFLQNGIHDRAVVPAVDLRPSLVFAAEGVLSGPEAFGGLPLLGKPAFALQIRPQEPQLPLSLHEEQGPDGGQIAGLAGGVHLVSKVGDALGLCGLHAGNNRRRVCPSFPVISTL